MSVLPTFTPASKIQLTGHLDGFCVRYGGEEVAVFPTWEGATAGYRAAFEAVLMLRRALAKPIEGAA